PRDNAGRGVTQVLWRPYRADLGGAMVNGNSDWTTWPSTDSTRNRTVYLPATRGGGDTGGGRLSGGGRYPSPRATCWLAASTTSTVEYAGSRRSLKTSSTR